MSCMWKDKHDCTYCAVQFCDARTDEFNMEKAIASASVPTYKGPDEIDKWLFDNIRVTRGACASQENLKYHVAREVAERLWPGRSDEKITPGLLEANGWTWRGGFYYYTETTDYGKVRIGWRNGEFIIGYALFPREIWYVDELNTLMRLAGLKKQIQVSEVTALRCPFCQEALEIDRTIEKYRCPSCHKIWSCAVDSEKMTIAWKEWKCFDSIKEPEWTKMHDVMTYEKK